MSRVAVALSGGVDSAVAAAILQDQGHEITGVFVDFWLPQEMIKNQQCTNRQAFGHAQEVARALGIKLVRLNYNRQFKDQIVNQFLSAYQTGKTPNPCIACNRLIKFGLLLDQVRTDLQADYLATGHYVQVRRLGKQYQLLRGKDKIKDQSYFLYNLTPAKLKYLLFPVGAYTKTNIRRLALKYDLPVAHNRESQDICFITSSTSQFLREYLHLKSGQIVDQSGRILGQHQGLPLYTLGQRTGLGLSGGPWYVVKMDRAKNQLMVTQDQTSLLETELTCQRVNWINQPKLPLSCKGQIRYRSQANSCRVTKITSRQYRVVFKQAQRAIMPGQSVVFYDKEVVLGGGVIC